MRNVKLTTKQNKFAMHVAKGETYASAYIKSYNVKPDASKNSIYVESSRLMDNPNVALRVNEIRREAFEKTEITLEDVIEQMSNWLMFDPLDIIDPETDCVKRLADMNEQARRSLSEIHVQETFGTEVDDKGNKKRVKTGELKKIKFIDKRAVSDQFMRKFGAYIADKSNASGDLEAIKEIIDKMKEK